jgi:hypothetical protein
MSTNEFLILGGIGIGSMIVAVALLDARDRITTLIRQRDEAQARTERCVLEVSRLLVELDTLTRQRDEAREETVMMQKLVQTAVPRILANIHHTSDCFYFTPKKVCNCGTRPAYEALTLLTSAAFTYYKINHQEDA